MEETSVWKHLLLHLVPELDRGYADVPYTLDFRDPFND